MLLHCYITIIPLYYHTFVWLYCYIVTLLYYFIGNTMVLLYYFIITFRPFSNCFIVYSYYSFCILTITPAKLGLYSYYILSLFTVASCKILAAFLLYFYRILRLMLFSSFVIVLLH